MSVNTATDMLLTIWKSANQRVKKAEEGMLVNRMRHRNDSTSWGEEREDTSDHGLSRRR